MGHEKFAIWVSRVIRWISAAGFARAAWLYDDLKILYLFALVAFVTGFLVPKKCMKETCT